MNITGWLLAIVILFCSSAERVVAEAHGADPCPTARIRSRMDLGPQGYSPSELWAPGWVLPFLSSFWGQEWENSAAFLASWGWFCPKLRYRSVITWWHLPVLGHWSHQQLWLCFSYSVSQTLSLFLPRHSYKFILNYKTVSTTHKPMMLTWDSAFLTAH